jgi:phospholipase C
VLAACASLLAVGPVAACTPSPSAVTAAERASGGPNGTYLVAAGIHKIKHVIVVMQENRSFDTYFGTYPRRMGSR